MTDIRKKARELAQEYLSKGDPTGWFEVFYANARGESSAISWADMKPNPNLAEWLAEGKITGAGQKALVIGCGLGDDAEVLAQHGFEVTAFDISVTAVAWCQKRFPASKVQYVVADILKPPQEWQEDFDFILEVYTLQVLPPDLRAQAIVQIAQLLAPSGILLLIARGRQPEEDQGTMPYPLTRGELAAFSRNGLKEFSFEDFMDGESPPVRHFRVEYHA